MDFKVGDVVLFNTPNGKFKGVIFCIDKAAPDHGIDFGKELYFTHNCLGRLPLATGYWAYEWDLELDDVSKVAKILESYDKIGETI